MHPQALGSAGTALCRGWSPCPSRSPVLPVHHRDRQCSISAFPVSRAQELAEGSACSAVITFQCLPLLRGQEEQWIIMGRTLTKEGVKKTRCSSSLVCQAGQGTMSVCLSPALRCPLADGIAGVFGGLKV